MTPAYNFHVKSVDDCDKISPTQRPQGYGGVAILWKKNIPATKQLDGSERTVVLQLGETTIISTYLLCRGKYANQDFADEIDQLDEICQKYASSTVILSGDMNVDLCKHS